MGTKNRLNPDAPVFTPRPSPTGPSPTGPSPTGPSPTVTELQQTNEEAAIELAEIDKTNLELRDKIKAIEERRKVFLSYLKESNPAMIVTSEEERKAPKSG